MATNRQKNSCQYLLLWLIVTCLPLTIALTVHVKNTDVIYNGNSMPDRINVTIVGDFGTSIFLNLKRVNYAEANVPIYTIQRHANGQYYPHHEDLQDNKNIAYYQDRESEAVIQVTRIGNEGEDDTIYELKGDLTINGRKFTLNPDGRFKRDARFSSSSSKDEASYSLLPKARNPTLRNDYIPAPPEIEIQVPQPKLPDMAPGVPPQNESVYSTPRPRRRRQSSTLTEIFVDIAAVADFACYNRFSGSHPTKAAILTAMREYYAIVFNGIDMAYKSISSTKYTFNVRLVKLMVCEAATSCPFTEKYRISHSPLDRVDSQDALNAFSDFAGGDGRKLLNPNDHAMLFTGYELTSRVGDSMTDSTAGLAYLSTLCRTDGKSSSVVEDIGYYQSTETCAHELGHSFSAKHDGDGNSCSSADRYIMSVGGQPATSSNKMNAYVFSTCSITSITSYIDSKLKTTQGNKCLTEKLAINNIPNVSNRLIGQEYTIDQQCQLANGNKSSFCRFTEDPCSLLFCSDPNQENRCIGFKAFMGTTCGNRKMCLKGLCTSDSKAPEVDDDCVFGDKPGVAFFGQTCPQVVENFGGYCYQSAVRSSCCKSCKTEYRNVSGCEYGDTVKGCTRNHCKFGSASTIKQCCRTCENRGAPQPTTTRPTTPRPTTKRPITEARTTVRAPPTENSVQNCIDSPTFTINGQPCTIIVRSTFGICKSNKRVKEMCCLTCSYAAQG